MEAISDDIVATSIDEIWQFWFGDHDVYSDDYKYPLQRWFAASWPIDVHLRQRFGHLHEAFLAAVLDGPGGRSRVDAMIHQWKTIGARRQPARGHMALVLLLDQMSRNIHRGTRHMFTTDPLALAVAVEVLDTPGLMESISRPEKLVLSLCLTHAEDRQITRRCVAIRKQWRSEIPETKQQLISIFDLSLMQGIKHHEVIDLFGRYPHRNQLLGRETTPDEAAYLRDNQDVDFMRSVAPIEVPAAAQERIDRYVGRLDSDSPRWIPLALLMEWQQECEAT